MRSPSRLILALGAAFAASSALAIPALAAASKDSVTIGMVLEPPGLDPTAGAAAAIGEITHYNIFEGLTKINEDFSDHAAAGGKMELLARPQDADLHSAQGRQVPGRRDVFLQGREILLRARRGQGLDQQGKSLLRLDRIDRRQRPRRRHAEVQGSELPGPVPPRPEHRCHRRREERGERSDQPGRHRPLQARCLEQGFVGHARQMGRLPRRRQDRHRARDVPLHQRSLGGGRGDARRETSTTSRNSRPPRTSRNSRAIRASRCWSAAPRARRSSA